MRLGFVVLFNQQSELLRKGILGETQKLIEENIQTSDYLSCYIDLAHFRISF